MSHTELSELTAGVAVRKELRLHLFAFVARKEEGGKRKAVVDAGALKVWYLARYWDPLGTGACVWRDARAASVLGVKADTVRKYRQRAERLGLLRVNVPHLRDGVLRKGEVYIRYAGAKVVAERFGFNPTPVIAVPLSVLRRGYTQIGVQLSAFYGQRVTYFAERGASKGKMSATRRRMEVLPAHRYLPRCKRSDLISGDGTGGFVPKDHRVFYSDTKLEVQYRRCTDAAGGFMPLPGSKSAPIVVPELYRACKNPIYRRGNIASKVFRFKRSEGNHRIYTYVDGSRVRPHGISQAWIAKKLKLHPSRVSYHLRGLFKCQVREMITETARTWLLLQKHPNFDPKRPWCTVVPKEEKVNEFLRPGVYTLQRAAKVFGWAGLRAFPNAFILFRDGTNIYDFSEEWKVVRLFRRKQKKNLRPKATDTTANKPTANLPQENSSTEDNALSWTDRILRNMEAWYKANRAGECAASYSTAEENAPRKEAAVEIKHFAGRTSTETMAACERASSIKLRDEIQARWQSLLSRSSTPQQKEPSQVTGSDVGGQEEGTGGRSYDETKEVPDAP